MKTLKFNPVNRDRLFFDRFRYSVSFRLIEASCLRAKSSQEVLKNISWRNSSRQRWGIRGGVTDSELANLMHMWSVLEPHFDSIKFSVSFDHIYVYGNDTAILTKIAQQSYTTYWTGQESLITKPRDVVIKENPKFKLRSYFKEKSLDSVEQQRLHTFLMSRRDSYGFTDAFRKNLEKTKWFYLMRHQWVEHDNMSDITMFALAFPGLIRKTVPVQAK